VQLNTSERASSRVGYILRLIRSFFSPLKKLSATALSWQFPRRLMLGTMPCCFSNDSQSLLVNWLPWSEWMIRPAAGSRFHTADTSAFNTRSVVIWDCIAQPTTFRK